MRTLHSALAGMIEVPGTDHMLRLKDHDTQERYEEYIDSRVSFPSLLKRLVIKLISM